MQYYFVQHYSREKQQDAIHAIFKIVKLLIRKQYEKDTTTALGIISDKNVNFVGISFVHFKPVTVKEHIPANSTPSLETFKLLLCHIFPHAPRSFSVFRLIGKIFIVVAPYYSFLLQFLDFLC